MSLVDRPTGRNGVGRKQKTDAERTQTIAIPSASQMDGRRNGYFNTIACRHAQGCLDDGLPSPLHSTLRRGDLRRSMHGPMRSTSRYDTEPSTFRCNGPSSLLYLRNLLVRP